MESRTHRDEKPGALEWGLKSATPNKPAPDDTFADKTTDKTDDKTADKTADKTGEGIKAWRQLLENPDKIEKPRLR